MPTVALHENFVFAPQPLADRFPSLDERVEFSRGSAETPPVSRPVAMTFLSLPAQVAAKIKAEIAAARWVDWLPGERALADHFQVSRRTLTLAIAQLTREGVLRSEHGRGTRILRVKAEEAPPRGRVVGLLTPEPLEVMRPGAILWVNDLRALLEGEQWRLFAYHGHKYFSGRPANALRHLVRSHALDCWVLAQSLRETQAWFAENKVPCVVAGRCHAGLPLPNIDMDWRALCFHAGGTLLAKGHRKAVLLLTKKPGSVASERDAEAGFRAAFARAGHPLAEPLVVYHERSRGSLIRAMERLYDQADPPTAIIAAHGMDYLTVTSFLAQRGWRVPQDVSVIARNDDAFLDALIPRATRYGMNPHRNASKIFKLVAQLVRGEVAGERHILVEPRLIKGESVARPGPTVKDT